MQISQAPLQLFPPVIPIFPPEAYLAFHSGAPKLSCSGGIHRRVGALERFRFERPEAKIKLGEANIAKLKQTDGCNRFWFFFALLIGLSNAVTISRGYS